MKPEKQPQGGQTAPNPLAKIEPPDSFHLSSAQGWLELGNLAEAGAELRKVAARWRKNQEFIETKWELESRRKNWKSCLALASSLLRLDPDKPFGWIQRSYALHELKRTQEAFDLLRPAVSRFPKVWTIPYNLACYTCQLGRIVEARIWLEQAAAAGDAKEIHKLAINDSDLAPLKSYRV